MECVRNIKVSFAFPNDAIILVELLEMLVMALETQEEGQQDKVSWAKNKFHEQGGLLDETVVWSAYVHCEETATLKNFICLGGMKYKMSGSWKDVI